MHFHPPCLILCVNQVVCTRSTERERVTTDNPRLVQTVKLTEYLAMPLANKDDLSLQLGPHLILNFCCHFMSWDSLPHQPLSLLWPTLYTPLH